MFYEINYLKYGRRKDKMEWIERSVFYIVWVDIVLLNFCFRDRYVDIYVYWIVV